MDSDGDFRTKDYKIYVFRTSSRYSPSTIIVLINDYKTNILKFLEIYPEYKNSINNFIPLDRVKFRNNHKNGILNYLTWLRFKLNYKE